MALTQTQLIQGPVTPGGVSLGLTSSDLAANSVTATQIAAHAVTAAKMLVYSGIGKTGTGSSQNIAHGLGVTPSIVQVHFTTTAAAQAVTYGTHTSTNVVVTVTSTGGGTDTTFDVLAFA